MTPEIGGHVPQEPTVQSLALLTICAHVVRLLSHVDLDTHSPLHPSLCQSPQITLAAAQHLSATCCPPHGERGSESMASPPLRPPSLPEDQELPLAEKPRITRELGPRDSPPRPHQPSAHPLAAPECVCTQKPLSWPGNCQEINKQKLLLDRESFIF